MKNHQYVVISGHEYPCNTSEELTVAGNAANAAGIVRSPLFFRARKEDDPATGKPCPDGRELKSKITIAEIQKLPCTHHNRTFDKIGNLLVDQHEDAERRVVYQIDHERKKFRRTGLGQVWPTSWEDNSQNS